MAIDAKVRHCCRYVTSSRGNVRWRSLCRYRSQWELIHEMYQAVVYRPLHRLSSASVLEYWKRLMRAMPMTLLVR